MLAPILALGIGPIAPPQLDKAALPLPVMAASLLGYWPGEWTESSALHSPSLTDPGPGGHSRQDSGSAYARVNQDRRSYLQSFASDNFPFDEDIYNAPTPPQTPPLRRKSFLSSTAANRMETRVMGDVNRDDTDWRMHHPPLELFNIPTGTSMEIESIVEPSVDKLQNMLAEEESLRQDVALRHEQETRKGKESMVVPTGDHENSQEGLEVHAVSIHGPHFRGMCPSDNVQPGSSADIHNNSIDGKAVLAQIESPDRIASPSMASSGDSGYGSRSSEPLSTKSRMGSIFSLRGTLRRSKNRINGARQTSASALTK